MPKGTQMLIYLSTYKATICSNHNEGTPPAVMSNTSLFTLHGNLEIIVNYSDELWTWLTVQHIFEYFSITPHFRDVGPGRARQSSSELRGGWHLYLDLLLVSESDPSSPLSRPPTPHNAFSTYLSSDMIFSITYLSSDMILNTIN